jgi:hypothetical protein
MLVPQKTVKHPIKKLHKLVKSADHFYDVVPLRNKNLKYGKNRNFKQFYFIFSFLFILRKKKLLKPN